MSAHQIHEYVNKTYVDVDNPILIVDNYYIIDKDDNSYSVVFSVTTNDCLYIETGKKFRFTINMLVEGETVIETGLVCTDLSPFELQEITSSPSS